MLERAGTLVLYPDSGGRRRERPVRIEGRSVVTDRHDKRVELRVSIPEGATPEEEERLIDEAVERETDLYVDETLNKLLKGFGK